ncbi:IS110 family transposase [Thomasclavelia ramosa]|uniref:IS110 family transposase n=1 Tax=Thomasclavelia ramosa TaxID=1547 RepID=UPI0020CAABC4|nr:IS110 family transposase [Thomasclavelia ramosa]
MKDTGHYNVALLQYLLKLNYKIALINPAKTDLEHKFQSGITKTDHLDTFTVYDVLDNHIRKRNIVVLH